MRAPRRSQPGRARRGSRRPSGGATKGLVGNRPPRSVPPTPPARAAWMRPAAAGSIPPARRSGSGVPRGRSGARGYRPASADHRGRSRSRPRSTRSARPSAGSAAPPGRRRRSGNGGRELDPGCRPGPRRRRHDVRKDTFAAPRPARGQAFRSSRDRRTPDPAAPSARAGKRRRRRVALPERLSAAPWWPRAPTAVRRRSR